MIKQYFKLDAGESKQILEDFRELTNPLVQQRADLIDKIKKDFHLTGRCVYEQHSQGQLHLLGFEVAQSARVPKWANLESFDVTDGESYYWEPKRNFKIGKSLSDRIREVNEVVITSFNEYVIGKVIGQQPFILYDMARHYAVAGYRNEVITLSIPSTEAQPIKFIGDWTTTKIKRSEYIALTEE